MSPLPERVSARIDATGPCWLWTGRLHDGYGYISVGPRQRRAHRLVYELLVGPVPPDLDLDHLCRIRRCVNPDHLEPVTRRENLRRSPLIYRRPAGTHCRNGHQRTPENAYERDGTH